jgi:Transposase DDE domain
MLGSTPITMGMQSALHDIPLYLITLVTALRAKLRDPKFLARHRVRAQDFTRQRQLTFPLLMLFVLQQTVKSIQRPLHEFLDELAQGQLFEPVTSGAVTHARAKLKASAFSELNRDCVLPAIYSPEHPIRRWRGHRLVGIDSSLVRLPESESLGRTFGWKSATNQHGATGTRYPEARLSVVYDVLNRAGWDTRLEPSTVGEVALASQQLEHLQPGDVELNDRGFTGYLYLALMVQRAAHFVARCSTGSFLAAQELFRLNRANQSRVVWLFAPADQKAEGQRLGLPLKMRVRFVSLRLPNGELEVLATSLLDEGLYPTEEFLRVYHWRWGHETFYLMLKGRLELENFSGRTVEAVQQDVQAAVLLANLESVLSEPAQAALNEPSTTATQPRQVNRSNSYHALKDQVLDLLYRDIPAPTVIHKLMRLFKGSPVAVRPNRKVPRRRKPSFNRSYHFQRRVKKTVF